VSKKKSEVLLPKLRKSTTLKKKEKGFCPSSNGDCELKSLLLVLLRRGGFPGSVSTGGKKKLKERKAVHKNHIYRPQSADSFKHFWITRFCHPSSACVVVTTPSSFSPPARPPSLRPPVRQAAIDDQRRKAQIFLKVSLWRGGFLQKVVAADEKLPECDSGN
jgi:serine/threonine protein kinase